MRLWKLGRLVRQRGVGEGCGWVEDVPHRSPQRVKPNFEKRRTPIFSCRPRVVDVSESFGAPRQTKMMHGNLEILRLRHDELAALELSRALGLEASGAQRDVKKVGPISDGTSLVTV